MLIDKIFGFLYRKDVTFTTALFASDRLAMDDDGVWRIIDETIDSGDPLL